MATTQQSSVQFTKLTTPSLKGGPVDGGGGLGIFAFDHTQSTDGDTGSTVNLIQVPPGRYEFLGHLSFIEYSAFGTARTMDIGWLAYTAQDGSAVVADADGLVNDLDVAAAGVTSGIGAGLGVNTARRKVFDSRSGVTIQAVNAGGTWPNAAQIHGLLVFVGPTS